MKSLGRHVGERQDFAATRLRRGIPGRHAASRLGGLHESATMAWEQWRGSSQKLFDVLSGTAEGAASVKFDSSDSTEASAQLEWVEIARSWSEVDWTEQPRVVVTRRFVEAAGVAALHFANAGQVFVGYDDRTVSMHVPLARQRPTPPSELMQELRSAHPIAPAFVLRLSAAADYRAAVRNAEQRSEQIEAVLSDVHALALPVPQPEVEAVQVS